MPFPCRMGCALYEFEISEAEKALSWWGYILIRSIADEMALALVSSAYSAVITFSCTCTLPRWRTHVLTSSTAALKAVSFICSSSNVFAIAASRSSMVCSL